MARPVLFKDEYVDQARRLTLLGLIDDEVAKFLCVTSQTINNWKKKYPAFEEALNQGKLGPDSEVAMSLYKRATGYSHEAVKIFMTEEGPVYAPYTEHYPPDTTACIFWLKNRQPEQWRDRVEVGGDGLKENHYHLHMEMPGAVKVGEDRGYRDAPVIEHKPQGA